MARRIKNVVDYFPHMVVHGKTMTIIESKYGLIGYAFFFKLLELLGKTENHYLDLRDEFEMEYVIAKLGVDFKTATEIFDLLAKLDSIDKDLWSQKIVFSQNFIDGINDAYKRRNNLCMQKNELITYLGINVNINEVNDDINTQSIVEESKEKEIKVPPPDKPVKHDIILDLIVQFQESYKEANGDDYDLITEGKDRAAMSKLLVLYKKKNPGQNTEQTLNGFRHFFDLCNNIKDDWLRRNMSPAIIMSKLNEIKNTLRNGNQRKSSKGGATDRELAELFARKLGIEQ
jgi:hypothetical protein